MKDLTHLYYFEQLLTEANNDLVRAAQKNGQLAIGDVCSLIPEPLLNLEGCFSVRLRAPRTGSMELGTYYMTSLVCECCRSILERAIEGGYEFLDAILAPDACAQMNRCVENIEHLKLCNKDKFFVSYADVPMKSDETALRHYVRQMKAKVLDPLHNNYGIDISDAALRKAVEEQNVISRLITEIGNYRKSRQVKITGYEFAVLCLATFCCPKNMLIPKLEETLEELKHRKPDETTPYKMRALLAGSEIDDPEFIRIIEEAGVLVVADRFCFGSLPGRQEIILHDDEDALTQICREYMIHGQCPRFMNTEKIEERHEYVHQMALEYGAEGLIYQQIKFCDYWGYERTFASHVLKQEYLYPVLSIERPYVVGNAGQIRTRVQAFVESTEYKQLKKKQEDTTWESKSVAKHWGHFIRANRRDAAENGAE